MEFITVGGDNQGQVGKLVGQYQQTHKKRSNQGERIVNPHGVHDNTVFIPE
jgi:hypothetical protein